ncbi:MAG: DUF5678 domain-containing protein [Candidatus Micrarchaeota archaeon]
MSTFEQRYKIHLWMVSHPKELEKHTNEWIAVTAKGIIASAKALADLTSNPKVQKERNKGEVLFAPIPDPNKAYVFGAGSTYG